MNARRNCSGWRARTWLAIPIAAATLAWPQHPLASIEVEEVTRGHQPGGCINSKPLLPCACSCGQPDPQVAGHHVDETVLTGQHIAAFIEIERTLTRVGPQTQTAFSSPGSLPPAPAASCLPVNKSDQVCSLRFSTPCCCSIRILAGVDIDHAHEGIGYIVTTWRTLTLLSALPNNHLCHQHRKTMTEWRSNWHSSTPSLQCPRRAWSAWHASMLQGCLR